jgi:Major Facilitator Superfamily
MEIFKNKNFTLMFLGRILTNIGDSLYAVAAMWLVYDLGGSSFYTGLAGFLSILPRIIQLLSGPIIDRLPFRGILVYSQLVQAILLLIVPLAYYFDILTVSLVLIITPILNICNSWVYPVQMAALPKILEKRQLTQGNSLFSVAYQGIDVACNAISGVLIVALGAVTLYFWNAIGFFIGAILFSQIRITAINSNEKLSLLDEENNKKIMNSKKMNMANLKHFFAEYKNDLVNGVRILTKTSLSTLLFGIMIINAAGGATFSILPIFSDKIGGADVYGAMLMVQALGSVLGAICVPYLKMERIRLGLVYAIAYIISGVAWFFSVYSPWTWLVILIYGLAWFPGGAVNVLINTVVQKGIPQQYLGLIFAATAALSGLVFPLGSLIGGFLGLWLDSSLVIALSGITVISVGVYWLFDSTSRHLPKIDQITEGYFSVNQKIRATRSDNDLSV